MATLSLNDVDDQLVDLLRQRAESRGRSVEAEHRAILEAALRSDLESFVAKSRRMREATSGRIHGDSTLVIRAYRDRRFGGS